MKLVAMKQAGAANGRIKRWGLFEFLLHHILCHRFGFGRCRRNQRRNLSLLLIWEGCWWIQRIGCSCSIQKERRNWNWCFHQFLNYVFYSGVGVRVTRLRRWSWFWTKIETETKNWSWWNRWVFVVVYGSFSCCFCYTEKKRWELILWWDLKIQMKKMMMLLLFVAIVEHKGEDSVEQLGGVVWIWEMN